MLAVRSTDSGIRAVTDREDEAGLNQYRVRDYRAWYAHITLAMPADDYLAATRAHGHHPARS